MLGVGANDRSWLAILADEVINIEAHHNLISFFLNDNSADAERPGTIAQVSRSDAGTRSLSMDDLGIVLEGSTCLRGCKSQ